MADPLAHVARSNPPGKFLNQTTLNLVLDSARNFRDHKNGQVGAGELDSGKVNPSNTVFVKNDTGGTLLPFSIVALDDPIIDPITYQLVVSERPVFSGITPTATTNAFAVTLEGSASGGICRAVIFGVACCDVNVTDAGHEYATPTVSDTDVLTSAETGGARILWKDSGTGTKRALILIGGDSGGGDSGFHARLTTESGGKWKFYRLTLNSSGAYVDDGGESVGFYAIPLAIDGINTCNPVAGLRVWMIDSGVVDGSGYPQFEFIPFGYATDSYPGLVSISEQHFSGTKVFHDVLIGNTSIIAGFDTDPLRTVTLSGGEAGGGYYPGYIGPQYCPESITAPNIFDWPAIELSAAVPGVSAIDGSSQIVSIYTPHADVGGVDLWAIPDSYGAAHGRVAGRFMVAGRYGTWVPTATPGESLLDQPGIAYTGKTQTISVSDGFGGFIELKFINGIFVYDNAELCSMDTYDCIDGTCLPHVGEGGTYATLSDCVSSGCATPPTTTTTTTTSTTTTTAEPAFCCDPGPTGDLCATFSDVTGLTGMPAGLTFTRSTYSCGGGDTCVIWSSDAWCGMPAGALVFRCSSGPVDPTKKYGFGYDPTYITSAAGGSKSRVCEPFSYTQVLVFTGLGTCGSGSLTITMAEGDCASTTTTTTTTTAEPTTTTTTTTAPPAFDFDGADTCFGASSLTAGYLYETSIDLGSATKYAKFLVSPGTHKLTVIGASNLYGNSMYTGANCDSLSGAGFFNADGCNEFTVAGYEYLYLFIYENPSSASFFQCILESGTC